jgi:hypothetical protein
MAVKNALKIAIGLVGLVVSTVSIVLAPTTLGVIGVVVSAVSVGQLLR